MSQPNSTPPLSVAPDTFAMLKPMTRARRPSDERRGAITDYIAHRIAELSVQRGWIASVARATGFSAPHISSIKSGTKGAGDDFIDAIAPHLGFRDAAHLKAHARDPDTVPGPNSEGPMLLGVFPNREVTIAFLGDEAEKEAITWLRKLAVQEDLPRSQWADLLIKQTGMVRLERGFKQALHAPLPPSRRN